MLLVLVPKLLEQLLGRLADLELALVLVPKLLEQLLVLLYTGQEIADEFYWITHTGFAKTN